MSTSSTVINQNIEIISVLCQSRSPGSAVVFNGILSALQSRYPTTGWTSDLLTARLAKGISQGLFIKVGSNPYGTGTVGYAIQPNMLRLNNPLNFLYEPFCSQIRPIGCCESGNTAVGAGTF